MTTENLERLLNVACQLLIIFENSNTCTEEDKNRISAIFNELKYADDIDDELALTYTEWLEWSSYRADNEVEITAESHPMTWLDGLNSELSTAISELIMTRSPQYSSQDIEDVSDSYQEQLEYQWWVDEQRALICRLEEQIKEHRATISPEKLKEYDDFYGENIPDNQGYE